MGTGVRAGVKSRLVGTRVRTSAGFEGVGTEGKNIRGDARLKKCGFVGRYSGVGWLARIGHYSLS